MWIRSIRAVAALCFTTTAIADINLYSSRKEALIQPLLNQFTQKTGVEVRLLTGEDDALLSRLKMEGKASPADFLQY